MGVSYKHHYFCPIIGISGCERIRHGITAGCMGGAFQGKLMGQNATVIGSRWKANVQLSECQGAMGLAGFV